MVRHRQIVVLLAVLGASVFCRADDQDAQAIRKAVERSTLNQAGTAPFHLKAVLEPTRDKDRASNRTGEVEIWWASPTRWKREVRSPEFHQIAIMNEGREWQKNEGDYFPEWLRETAVALIDPVPSLDAVLRQVESGEQRTIKGMKHFSWMMMSSNGEVQKAMGGALAIGEDNGLLRYASGFGWSGDFHDYKSFHGRMVARTVGVGSPEVTAKVTTLEDLGPTPADFFDAARPGSDAPLLQTAMVEETTLRKNLLAAPAPVWPPLKDGPLEGVWTTEIVVDRAGAVREVGTIVSDNPALEQAAREVIQAMRFKPYVENGAPVQVLSRITMAFKTVRPAGIENFDTARNYFERGRHANFPAAGNGTPYVLHASFRARMSSGIAGEGKYVDTWKSDTEWKREASIGASVYVRARSGDQRYELAAGPDAPLLRFLLRVMEPIPAMDTFVESDWKIKRDTVDGVKTIRVLTGYESPSGELDPQQARAYWFDETGTLIRAYFNGMETRRSNFTEFAGVKVAQEITVLYNGAPGIIVRVTQVGPAGEMPADTFQLPGHEYTRAFTDEAR